MLKVLKFGGSSMADAHQLEKVRSIVEADPARRVVVVSAAGKRFKDDHKITDLLYLCHAHLQYGVSCDGIFDMVRSRYLEIRDELGLSTPLEAEFDALRAKYGNKIAPVVVPIWDEDKKIIGIIDVMNKRAYEMRDGKREEIEIPEGKEDVVTQFNQLLANMRTAGLLAT